MTKYRKIKKRIFDIIQIGQRGDLPSLIFDEFLVALILLNITMLVLETFSLPEILLQIFHVVEIVTIILFIIEYALRIWTANLLYPGDSKAKAIFKFIVSFDGIVDLLTIIPVFFLAGFSALRILRVARILHLFRINASYDSFNVITNVLYSKRKQILSSLLIIGILMLASSLCMYNVEHDVQPDVFENAFSGLWWSVSTILTVGYGDIYPITVLGKAMAIVISLLGVGVVAIPTGIISAGFVEQHSKLENTALINKVSETNTLLKEVNLKSGTEESENSGHSETVISPNENLVERLMRDRANTDPETRKLFDNYLAEIFRD